MRIIASKGNLYMSRQFSQNKRIDSKAIDKSIQKERAYLAAIKRDFENFSDKDLKEIQEVGGLGDPINISMSVESIYNLYVESKNSLLDFNGDGIIEIGTESLCFELEDETDSGEK